jgi:hypothetical protein
VEGISGEEIRKAKLAKAPAAVGRYGRDNSIVGPAATALSDLANLPVKQKARSVDRAFCF